MGCGTTLAACEKVCISKVINDESNLSKLSQSTSCCAQDKPTLTDRDGRGGDGRRMRGV